jgi:hypothetical protein
MADRRINHAYTKLTCHSRASARLEQRSHRRPKAAVKTKHVWAIRARLELAKNHRDLALFNMTIDSKLRGCDLFAMKVVDVMASGQIKETASVLQSKTQNRFGLRLRRARCLGS